MSSIGAFHLSRTLNKYALTLQPNPKPKSSLLTLVCVGSNYFGQLGNREAKPKRTQALTLTLTPCVILFLTLTLTLTLTQS